MRSDTKRHQLFFPKFTHSASPGGYSANMNALMKEVLAALGSAADGAIVSKVLKEKLPKKLFVQSI